MSGQRITVRISPKLEESEKDCIREFQRRCIELLDTAVLKRSGSIRSTLNWSAGNPVAVRVVLPPEEELRSFYMAFRFFYLQKEKASFLRIANIVNRRSESDLVHKHITALKKRWHGSLAREGWSVSVNGEELTAGRLIDLWFNAHYFHSDADKRRDLELVSRILSTEFARYLLADAVFEATKAVVKLYSGLKEFKV